MTLPRFVMVSAGYPPAATAGLERGCQRLSEALVARGSRVSVLTLATSGLPATCDEGRGVRVHRVLRPVTAGPLWGLSYTTQVALWLTRRRRDWDIVLCHQLYLHSVAAVPVARRLGKQSANLLVAADAYSDIRRLGALRGGDWLLRTALAADAHFALSARARSELIAAGVPASRVHPYRYFVDVERFSPGAAVTGGPLLYLGRFDRQKNLDLLIEAFERVHARHPGLRLRLVGKGPEELRVRTRVAASPAGGAVQIDTWTDDPAHAYRQAAVLVSASDAEGLSNVMIEAMACGLPVVTTDVSGARDALGDPGWPEPLPAGTFQRGTGGLLANRGDAVGLARAIEHVATDPQERARLAVDARSRALDHYSEVACVTDFLESIDLLTARRGR